MKTLTAEIIEQRLLALPPGGIEYFRGGIDHGHCKFIWVERSLSIDKYDQSFWVADMAKKYRTRGPLLGSARAAADQVVSWLRGSLNGSTGVR